MLEVPFWNARAFSAGLLVLLHAWQPEGNPLRLLNFRGAVERDLTHGTCDSDVILVDPASGKAPSDVRSIGLDLQEQHGFLRTQY